MFHGEEDQAGEKQGAKEEGDENDGEEGMYYSTQ